MAKLAGVKPKAVSSAGHAGPTIAAMASRVASLQLARPHKPLSQVSIGLTMEASAGVVKT